MNFPFPFTLCSLMYAVVDLHHPFFHVSEVSRNLFPLNLMLNTKIHQREVELSEKVCSSLLLLSFFVLLFPFFLEWHVQLEREVMRNKKRSKKD